MDNSWKNDRHRTLSSKIDHPKVMYKWSSEMKAVCRLMPRATQVAHVSARDAFRLVAER
jgi:hypothetical protein